MSADLVHIRLDVDTDSPAEEIVATWLRRWRRHDVRRHGKIEYLLQGATKRMHFRAPRAACNDLVASLAGSTDATIAIDPS